MGVLVLVVIFNVEISCPSSRPPAWDVGAL